MKAPSRNGKADGIAESDRHASGAHPREQLELFGHDAAEQSLLEAYRSGRFPHAWIFGGREGIGKATLAWRVARYLVANPDAGSAQVRSATSLAVPGHAPAARSIAAMAAPNVVLLRREWNHEGKPAKHFSAIRVDEVRAATHRFRLSAADGGWRVAIVDCADDLNPQAANALLKIIEEPPPRSLFLLVSHQPGRLLPTIRSRCRRLLLSPLTAEHTASALGSLGEDVHDDLLSRARGSVGHALTLLGARGSDVSGEVERHLRRLPAVDWREVSGLAERIAPARAERDFEAFVGSVCRYLDDEVRDRAGQGVARLAPLAEVWETFQSSVRSTELLNLDKRPLVLSLFENLSAATAVALR